MSFTVKVDAAARDANVNVYAPRFSKNYPSSEKVMAVTIFHRISAPLVLIGSLSESDVALHESFDAAQAHVETELKERVPSILSQVMCKRYDGRVFILRERFKLAAHLAENLSAA